MWLRVKALDIFECMIRIDEVSHSHYLSALNRSLDQWALTDPRSLCSRLLGESGQLTLATLLTVSAPALGRLSPQLPLKTWLEAARAANKITPDHAAGLKKCRTLEPYLLGESRRVPRLSLPWVLPLPAPSMLRAVQNFRFRQSLLAKKVTKRQ